MLDAILRGDALEVLRGMPDGATHCIVTSPPYWALRDYGVDGQIGLEQLPVEYVARLVEVFREARRVLREDGVLFLNVGDTYCSDATIREDGRRSIAAHAGRKASLPKWRDYVARGRARYSSTLQPLGLKDKDLIGVPWRLAFALQADGWYLRSAIIWRQRSGKQRRESDRPQSSYEHVFLLSKSAKYHFDRSALPPQFQQDVWEIDQAKNDTEHLAVMPSTLATLCILAGCPVGGVVLDPFMGSGTVALAAQRSQRHYLGIELNADYVALAERRIAQASCQPGLWSAGAEVSA